MEKIKKIDYLISEAIASLNSSNLSRAEAIISKIFSNSDYVTSLDQNRWLSIGSIAMSLGKFYLAKSAYIRAKDLAGAAYVSVVSGKIDEAKEILRNTKPSPVASWSRFLVDLFSGSVIIKKWPTYLQIRHFLEITVNYLLIQQNRHHINMLLTKVDKLSEINMDAEKLIGYAFYHYGDVENAIKILNNAASRNQYDGEIYYYLGQIYFNESEYSNALMMLENAKLIMPNHNPTLQLQEKIQYAMG